jgi:hypothetical protein
MNPFDWKKDPRPSIFMKDAAFKPRPAQTYAHLSPEENLIAYKQFSTHSRAHPNVKPSLNKHEIS